MDISLILKVAGVGLLVSILTQVLGKTGRDDHAALVSLAGILIVLVLIISKLSELIGAIQSVFGLG